MLLGVLVLWFVIGILGLCAFGFWVWSLIDCLTRTDDTFEPIFGSANPKIVWALIIFFAHILGTIIYLLVAGSKNSPKNATPQTQTADPRESRRILEMIASGKITAAEGQRRLAALETREQQAVTAQPRTSTTPQALKIGCLVVLAFLVLFVVLAAFTAFQRARAQKHARIEQQIQQQLRTQFGHGQQVTFSAFTNISPAAVKQ